MSNRRIAAVGTLILLFHAPSLFAHPLHPSIFDLTIRQQFDVCRAVVIGRVADESRDERGLPRTHYEITQVLAQSPERHFRAGEQVVLSGGPPKAGEQFLLSAEQDSNGSLCWTNTATLSPSGLAYVSRLAELRQENDKLLAYCIRLIESEDAAVRDDVHAELLRASIDKLAPAKFALQRDRLETLFADPKTRDLRRGLYSLLLGLCGDEGSQRLLRKAVVELQERDIHSSTGSRIMCGYMMLAGDEGIAWIVERKLNADGLSHFERYAALSALRQLQSEVPEHLSRETLCRALRPLLDLPDFADIAVSELARLKDWDVQDRLIRIYTQPENTNSPASYNSRSPNT